MADVFSRPTVFTGAIAAGKARRHAKGTPQDDLAPSGSSQPDSRTEPAAYRVSRSLPTDEAKPERTALRSNQTPGTRRQTRTIKRTSALSALQPASTAIPAHWLTIGTYLREHFLARPVCVLTHAGRFSGQLTAVGADGIVLQLAEGKPCELQFNHILSVGHLK